MIDRKTIFEWLRSSQWTVFAAMVVALVLKSMFWHAQLFMDWDIRLHYMIYTAAWIALPVLVCKKRPWWTIAIFVIISAWMFSCFVYYKVWGMMVTMDEVRNLGNLKGFESSIFADWKWNMLLWLALPDALYIALLCWMRPAKKRCWKEMLAIVAAIVLLIPVRQLEYYRPQHQFLKGYNPYGSGWKHFWFNNEPLFNPAYQPWMESNISFANQASTKWESRYVHKYGIVDYGLAMLAFDYYYQEQERTSRGEPVTLTAEDEQIISELYDPKNGEFIPERSLILILVESLEPWALDAKGKDGSWVMPNLREFIDNNNTFVATNMQAMIVQGCSSDGQLMSITGLAPINKGITVTLYGEQRFPNYAHYYPSSRTVNPSPGSWRQPVVNPNYGIKILEESDTVFNDEGVFRRMQSIKMDTVSFVFLITESSHVPFNVADMVKYDIDPAMPEKVAKYLKCMHYMDEQFGTLLKRFKESEELRNCDIVITGDHSIMSEADIRETKTYTEKCGKTIANLEFGQIPLILYSPTLRESKVYEQQCLQVDIYPTILGLIGCENPQWKGVGMNLLDSVPRRVTIEQAYKLSDKLIRSNYFSTH